MTAQRLYDRQAEYLARRIAKGRPAQCDFCTDTGRDHETDEPCEYCRTGALLRACYSAHVPD